MKNLQLRQLAIDALENLSEDASWNEIQHAVKSAAVEILPEDIVSRATKVFGDKDKTIAWLITPNRALGNLAPIEVLEEKNGKGKVFTVLARIEHGVFS